MLDCWASMYRLRRAVLDVWLVGIPAGGRGIARRFRDGTSILANVRLSICDVLQKKSKENSELYRFALNVDVIAAVSLGANFMKTKQIRRSLVE